MRSTCWSSPASTLPTHGRGANCSSRQLSIAGQLSQKGPLCNPESHLPKVSIVPGSAVFLVTSEVSGDGDHVHTNYLQSWVYDRGLPRAMGGQWSQGHWKEWTEGPGCEVECRRPVKTWQRPGLRQWSWDGHGGELWKGQVRAPEERPCQDGTHNSLGCLFPPMGPQMRIPG